MQNGTRDLQIAYSIDGKHWTHMPINLFESDYGTWGSEKKMYYPVLSYDGKKYRAVFIPSLKNGQIAITESEDFALWKPQDYPYVAESEFQSIVETQERVSKKNVIRVPYAAIQNLMSKKIRADRNGAWERDNFVASGASIANNADPISATLTINWDDRKAISPNLMGIFFEDISYAADGGLYAELITKVDSYAMCLGCITLFEDGNRTLIALNKLFNQGQESLIIFLFGESLQLPIFRNNL